MSDFNFLPGKNKILLIAPHGRPEDDTNTGELTKKLAVKLDCYAAINEKYRKPDEESEEVTNADLQIADLNNKKSINDAGLTADWLDEIKKRKKIILDNIQNKGIDDTCYIFLIHGAKDKNVKAVCQEADILIGIGRSKDKSEVKKDRPTATEDNLKNFLQSLKDEGSIEAVEAKAAQKDTDDKENWYAGHAKNNLNQCFVERPNGILDPKVQSFQVEIKNSGFRDNDDSIKKTAARLAAAIGKLTGVVPIVEVEVVEEEKNLPFDPQRVDEDDLDIKNILLIAPNAHPNDGANIGDIARKMYQELSGDFNCQLIVNEKYKLPQVKQRVTKFDEITNKILDFEEIEEKVDKDAGIVNWKSIEQAKKHLKEELIQPIEEFLKSPGNTILFWINGTTDGKLFSKYEPNNRSPFEDQLRTINYRKIDGEVGDEGKWRDGRIVNQSIDSNTLHRFEAFLEKKQPKPIRLGNSPVAKINVKAPRDDMNQWCQLNGYSSEKVKSLQISLRKPRIRDTADNIEKTGEVLANALRTICKVPEETSVDKKLVTDASDKLFGIFSGHIENAMLEAGEYLIDTFYNGSIKRGRLGKPVKHKSMLHLVESIRKNNPYAPSQSWIYRSVQLVVENHDIKKAFPEILFYTYRNILLSQKVLLLSVHDNSLKQKLVKEIDEKGYTVAQLRKRLRELGIIKQPSAIPPNLLELIDRPNHLFLEKNKSLLTIEYLSSLPVKEIEQLKTDSSKQVQKIRADISERQRYIEQYESLIEAVKNVGQGNGVEPHKDGG